MGSLGNFFGVLFVIFLGSSGVFLGLLFGAPFWGSFLGVLFGGPFWVLRFLFGGLFLGSLGIF